MPLSELRRRNRNKFIVQQGVFWLISIVLFTVVLIYTRGDFNLYNITFRMAVNILVTVALLAVSVYINLLWLIPSYFNKRRFLLFTILEICNILLFIVLNYFVSGLFEGPTPPANIVTEFIAEFILVLIFLVVSTLLKFMRDSIALQDVELRITAVEKQKIEAELLALRAQVNPHFFFNTLNSLYALTLDRSDKAPEMILRLSELMRYVIYESRDDLVPMGKQLEFLQNYIFVEQVRTGDGIDIRFDVSGEHRETRVAPLIYLAFVENAFKHGARDAADRPFIHIRLDLSNRSKVDFTIENRIDPYRENTRPGGFGLENVRKRLELQYPEKHTLEITEKESVYRVHLTIQTS